jgi:hypothetical protein
MNFKERAIYQLPNGRELVACVTRGDKTVLYNLSASESGRYELNSEGRLLFDGQLTAWQMDDLLETGRVAAPEVTSILRELHTAGRETTNEQST